MNVYIYARGLDADVVNQRLAVCRDYVNTLGLSVTDEFVDIGQTEVDRNGFQALLKNIGKRDSTEAVNIIVVGRIDLLYRMSKDYIALENIESRVEIHDVTNQVIHSNDSLPSNPLYHALKFALDKAYADSIPENTRKEMIESARCGVYPCKAPYGYMSVIRNGARHIEIDPARSPIVQNLYDLAANTNFSTCEIAENLNQTYGLSGRYAFTAVRVSHTIRSIFYFGWFEWGEMCYKGTHQSLVSYDVWKRAQR